MMAATIPCLSSLYFPTALLLVCLFSPPNSFASILIFCMVCLVLVCINLMLLLLLGAVGNVNAVKKLNPEIIFYITFVQTKF